MNNYVSDKKSINYVLWVLVEFVKEKKLLEKNVKVSMNEILIKIL